ncbi:MAG: four helix bundle protein [Bacteroidetes bacterium]|nr:four helix bundle protein [Bacteroidota bacterium]
MKENIVLDKSYSFAVEIVKAYQHLSKKKKEFILSKQLLRSGTSIGANIEEAVGGYSKKDFTAKLSIAYKEARETKYWLRLLKDTNYLNSNNYESLFNNCDELLRLLYSIINSSRK